MTIDINVRLGNDSRVARSAQDNKVRGGLKTPMSWFRLVNRHGYHIDEFDVGSPLQGFAEQVLAILSDRG